MIGRLRLLYMDVNQGNTKPLGKRRVQNCPDLYNRNRKTDEVALDRKYLQMMRTLSVVALTLAVSLLAGIRAYSEDSPKAQAPWERDLEAAETMSLSGIDISFGEGMYNQALAEAPDDTARATIQNQRGVMLMQLHKFKSATSAFSTALLLRRKLLGEADPVTLKTMSNLALATYKLGDEVEAEKLYKSCIDLKRKACPGSESLAKTLTNLAHLYSDERRHDEAKSCYTEALEIDKKNFGASHDEVANDLFNLGAFFYGCNDTTQALTYFEQAKEMYAAVADKYGSVKALHYISLCHASLHEFDKAKDASLNALALHEELKGKGHPDTLVHLISAADCAAAAGDLEQAGKLYKQALSTARTAQTPSNAKLAECNLDLAQICLKQNHPDDAEQYFKKAIVHFDLLSNKDKRSLYELPMAYSRFLRSTNRIAESEQVAHNYLDIYAPAH